MTYLKEIIVLLSRLIMQFGGAAGIKRFLDNFINSTDQFTSTGQFIFEIL